jgi:hypothetical protein
MWIHVYMPVFVPFWVWTQLTLALIFAGAHIWRTGWLAVPTNAKPKPVKDKDGNFIKTADSKKVKLDPLSGVAVSVVDAPEAAKPLKKFAIAAQMLPAESAKPSPTDDDFEPMLLDEDDIDFTITDTKGKTND